MRFKEQSKKKAVTFSYDDGVSQDVRLIELLGKYNLKCTFNLNSGCMNTRDIWTTKGPRVYRYKIHRDDIRSIYAGHEIAAHTMNHFNLTTLEEPEIIHQVEQDRLTLSELAGYEVVGMAYPCGGVNNDDRVARIIKDNTGVKYCRTIITTNSFDEQENLFRFNPTLFHLDFDLMMEAAQRFLEQPAEKPQILYVWGHSYEMDLEHDYWYRLEEFFKIISNREDIFYGTNKEILL